ncbi:endo-1,4-beta-xylanase [Asticcacaulis sp. AC402]|uniref:endo-1,4-beta-xylanase n=1 Tax=Asticcacaulis sp. AC402 TaxID=1282361 RepID=UPI0003C40550|nr:endo-1,4-beta-xylanase [Asticcacaulis sp. AC402]ESQ76007.1 endo-1,4-beta-xylanase [Asticcacaulis sp. AC402]
MDRRALIAGAAALTLSTPACAAYPPGLPPLKSVSTYPLGVAVRHLHLSDPDWARLAVTNFSQLTAEWEMKMEYMLRDDGSLQFDRADALAAFARTYGMKVHGHTLVWYAQDGLHFQKLKGTPDAFLNAYVAYIQKVTGRYGGIVRGWDVVNEPIWNDGRGLRPCLWREVLGDDYIGLAFEAAHQADPAAVLFLNDYNLELTPAKRTTFLKLCERLLKEGAPLHGIGTQAHISADLNPAAMIVAIRDIASLGLQVHISELDISLRGDRLTNVVKPRLDQLKVFEAVIRAYNDVPARQRYGLTVWSLRDKDSWLNSKRERKGPIADAPVLFDDRGRPKAMAERFVEMVR